MRAGHLWIFSNEIDTRATPLDGFAAGDQVRVMSEKGQCLGVAYVNPATLIAARLLTREDRGSIGSKFLLQRLRTALELRSALYPQPFYRAVFGESDGLPGLILDRYGDVVVGQIATVGMERLRSLLERAIAEVLAPKTLIWKNDSGARALEGLPEYVETVGEAAPERLQIIERWPEGRELRFEVSATEGQKTGWFYDQSFNRSLLSRFLPAGARVLDVCSYAGGWAVAAQAAGASEITCVDASAAALDYAEQNLQRNRSAGSSGASLNFSRGDAFEVLADLAESGQRFDAVIVDPPAFIKRRKDIPVGQAAYRKLNQLALRVLEPGGLLVSCSCSYHLEGGGLLEAVQSAARHVDRHVLVLHAGGQSPDHPIHPAIPETRYLKALFCRVTRS